MKCYKNKKLFFLNIVLRILGADTMRMLNNVVNLFQKLNLYFIPPPKSL